VGECEITKCVNGAIIRGFMQTPGLLTGVCTITYINGDVGQFTCDGGIIGECTLTTADGVVSRGELDANTCEFIPTCN
jgi:hypothetical protein